MLHIKAAGFIVAETLFDAHTVAIFVQVRMASNFIRDDCNHFWLALFVGRPGNRHIRLYLDCLGEQDILKIEVTVHGNQVVQSV